MRAACRHFLDIAGALGAERLGPELYGSTPAWMSNDAIGELRAHFGIHVGQLSAKFGIDIEGELASTLPAEESGDDAESASPPWHLRRRR
jgi:hypothetical protein